MNHDQHDDLTDDKPPPSDAGYEAHGAQDAGGGGGRAQAAPRKRFNPRLTFNHFGTSNDLSHANELAVRIIHRHISDDVGRAAHRDPLGVRNLRALHTQGNARERIGDEHDTTGLA